MKSNNRINIFNCFADDYYRLTCVSMLKLAVLRCSKDYRKADYVETEIENGQLPPKSLF